MFLGFPASDVTCAHHEHGSRSTVLTLHNPNSRARLLANEQCTVIYECLKRQ